MNLVSFDKETLPALCANGRILKAPEAQIVFEAVELLECSRREAVALRQQAQESYESEKARGYAEGLEAGNAQAIKHHLSTVLATIRYLESSRDQMAKTMMLCLRKILASLPPEELALSLAERALDGLREQNRVVLHVHAEDIDYIASRLESLRAGRDKEWLQVMISPTMKRGHCVLESPIGLVDASADTQLEVISEALKTSL